MRRYSKQIQIYYKSKKKQFIGSKTNYFNMNARKLWKKKKKLRIGQKFINELKESFETYNTSSCF